MDAKWILATLLMGTWVPLLLWGWSRLEARLFPEQSKAELMPRRSEPAGDNLDRAFAEAIVSASDRYRDLRAS